MSGQLCRSNQTRSRGINTASMRNTRPMRRPRRTSRPRASLMAADLAAFAECRWHKSGTATATASAIASQGRRDCPRNKDGIRDANDCPLAGAGARMSGTPSRKRRPESGKKARKSPVAGIVRAGRRRCRTTQANSNHGRTSNSHRHFVRGRGWPLSSRRRDAGAVVPELPGQHDLRQDQCEQRARAASGPRSRPAAASLVPARRPRPAHASPGRVPSRPALPIRDRFSANPRGWCASGRSR